MSAIHDQRLRDQKTPPLSDGDGIPVQLRFGGNQHRRKTIPAFPLSR
ncbi:hypothetical protein [Paenibacillus thiaminolyticus]|nr:hypothetical protein [Paenibacillus thiaminolyticus]WII40214.1 hypothetical protein O0V01_14520 [Paenibacillus thiaminolyticus]